MAELNLKQIIDRLNAEFVGDTRKLVFWYDDKADFAEDLENVELENAKIYRLQPDNQFYTKYFLERVDTTTNYLVYAPFPKPDVRENHLEDTLLYSRRFFADRASLLSVDLGIEEKYKLSSKSTSSSLPIKSAPSGSTIWRSRTSTRKTSSPGCSAPSAKHAPAPLRRWCVSCSPRVVLRRMLLAAV